MAFLIGMGFSRAVIFCVLVVLSVNEVFCFKTPTLAMMNAVPEFSVLKDQRIEISMGKLDKLPWRLTLEPDDGGVNIVETTRKGKVVFTATATQPGAWALAATASIADPKCPTCTATASRTMTVVEQSVSSVPLLWSKSQLTVYDSESGQRNMVQQHFEVSVTPGVHRFYLERQNSCKWKVLTGTYNVKGTTTSKKAWGTNAFLGWSASKKIDLPAISPSSLDYFDVTVTNSGKQDLVFSCDSSRPFLPVGGVDITVKSIKVLVEIDSA